MRRATIRLDWASPVKRALPDHRLRQRVGLLGGSFNPAHDGHRSLSLTALKTLKLDEVWWMVSPQNPLKSAKDTASLSDRMRDARIVASHPRIRVTDIETRLGTRYTHDTLKLLTRDPERAFVWLMGADNLEQLPRWKRWRDIVSLVPIAVFDRAPYTYGAFHGQAAIWMQGNRIDDSQISGLADHKPPCWGFIRMKRHPASSTDIRNARA